MLLLTNRNQFYSKWHEIIMLKAFSSNIYIYLCKVNHPYSPLKGVPIFPKTNSTIVLISLNFLNFLTIQKRLLRENNNRYKGKQLFSSFLPFTTLYQLHHHQVISVFNGVKVYNIHNGVNKL